MPERNYEIKLGIVATGDIFCTEKYMKEKIRTKFDADIVDMECGAIAQSMLLRRNAIFSNKNRIRCTRWKKCKNI